MREEVDPMVIIVLTGIVLVLFGLCQVIFKLGLGDSNCPLLPEGAPPNPTWTEKPCVTELFMGDTVVLRQGDNHLRVRLSETDTAWGPAPLVEISHPEDPEAINRHIFPVGNIAETFMWQGGVVLRRQDGRWFLNFHSSWRLQLDEKTPAGQK